MESGRNIARVTNDRSLKNNRRANDKYVNRSVEINARPEQRNNVQQIESLIILTKIGYESRSSVIPLGIFDHENNVIVDSSIIALLIIIING